MASDSTLEMPALDLLVASTGVRWSHTSCCFGVSLFGGFFPTFMCLWMLAVSLLLQAFKEILEGNLLLLPVVPFWRL